MNEPRTLTEATLRLEHHREKCADCAWVAKHPYTKREFCEEGRELNGWHAALVIGETIRRHRR